MTPYRGKPWAGLMAGVVVAVAMVAIPVFLIRPFAPQTPGMLDIAFGLRRWSPVVTAAALVAALWLGLRVWRASAGFIPRAGATLALLLVLGAAWMARQNHFEWMFAPLPNAGFVSAPAADFIRGSDMVLAVALNGDAAAYPVNQLAYHHVVEDTIGRIPIVATY